MKVLRCLSILVLAVCISGCATIQDWIGLSPSNDSYANSPAQMIGYGVDNYWMDISPYELGDLLIENNQTFTSIEFLGTRYYSNPEPLFDKFNSFISAMRARKIVVLISICNDNKGSGKYGDDGIPLSQYKLQLEKALAYLKSKGSEGVVIQPVAETQTSTGTWFEGRCLTELKGFKLCWNHGSRPSSVPAGYWTFSYHPGSLTDIGKPNGLTITDHGTLLRALNQGGDVFGYANPTVLEAYAKKVLASKNRGFGYYGFGHKKIDKAAIKAIGNAVKATRNTNP